MLTMLHIKKTPSIIQISTLGFRTAIGASEYTRWQEHLRNTTNRRGRMSGLTELALLSADVGNRKDRGQQRKQRARPHGGAARAG